MTSSDNTTVETLIGQAATSPKAVAGLFDIVDERCAADDWDGLLELRARLAEASATVPAVGPVALRAEYRLALLGDPEHAAAVLPVASNRFEHGPLTEVVASVHSWETIAPHIDSSALRSTIAYERVLRGEDLDAAPGIDRSLFDLPLVQQEWEPDHYPVANYAADGAGFPAPKIEDGSVVDLPPEPELISDLTSAAALNELTRPWTEDSNGVSDAVVVKGDVFDAIGAFGWDKAKILAISHEDALAMMAWAAASGGAYGPRRGASAGRFSAWWTVAALAGLTEDWPVEPDEIGDAAQSLRWYAWETDLGDGKPVPPWRLQLAAVDPDHRLAWAVSAIDLTDDALDTDPWARLRPQIQSEPDPDAGLGEDDPDGLDTGNGLP